WNAEILMYSRSLSRVPICIGLVLMLLPSRNPARGAPRARPTAAQAAQARTIEAVRKAVQAFHAGDYASTKKGLGPLFEKGALNQLRSRDYALFLLAESEALLGDELHDSGARRLWQSAVVHYREVDKVAGSPLSPLAKVRVSDCLLKIAPDGKLDSEAAA